MAGGERSAAAVRLVSLAARSLFSTRQPRGKGNAGTAGCAARAGARSRGTTPVVIGCNDFAGACGVVQGANVGDANVSAEKIGVMGVDGGRCVDGDVHLLVLDYILRNDGAANWRAATAAIDVYSGGAWSCGVVSIGAVSGDEVADDHIPIHIIGGCAEGGTDVGVE